MPFAQARGAKLFFESTGRGTPIVFVHEYGADHRSWEAQVRWFSRFHRCITFNARGFNPSERAAEKSDYSYRHFYEDIGAVMDAAGVDSAFVVGLSMGAYSAVHFGLHFPARALGLVLAGVGSGSSNTHDFKAGAIAMANAMRANGMGAWVNELCLGPNRVQLYNKDPRTWEEARRQILEHDPVGSADTLEVFQGERPVLYDFEAELRALQVPTLIAVGDEDMPCMEPSLFLKRTIPAAGLWVCPRTGHCINLEEPAQFNEAVQGFIYAVQQNSWTSRDPRSLAASRLADADGR